MVTIQPVVRSDVLLRWQRNEVLNHVKDAGFTRDEFDWEVVRGINDEGHWVSRLFYKADAAYSFVFEPLHEHNWIAHFAPGEFTQSEDEGCGEFSATIVRVDWWLSYLRREIESPDLWDDLLEDALSDLEGPGSNAPLTSEERRIAVLQVEAVRTYVISINPPQEKLDEANKKLDFLIDATTRLGRFDWRAAAVGMAFEIAMQVAFSPDQARHILELVTAGLLRVLSGGT